MEDYLTDHFPIGEISHRWGAQAYSSADGIPYIGKYNDKVYRFLINARTGEVQGERPYSKIKIALLVIGILAIIGVIVYFTTKK